MAEEQKNVELHQESKPEVIAAPAPPTEIPVESKPVAETPVENAPITTEDKPLEETKLAETTEESPKTEEKEIKPVEEGHLSHKAQGLSFPKNLIASKEFFFFGSDAFEAKSLSHYLRSEKSTETAHHNIAWASHTGKGLLFLGDKKTPSSVINLTDATEPETDGSNKFHFTSKGNKHSFKATSTAERDNWVSQLKLKIAEAKEIAPTVAESESYKNTIESYKPTPIVKEEKVHETPKEEVKTTEEIPSVHDAVTQEPAKEEEVKEELKKEEVKSEEPKRRSASRKRGSFFGFGKKEEKKEELKEEATPTEESAVVDAPADTHVAAAVDPVAPIVPVAATSEPVVETEAPKIEEAPVTETAPTLDETKPLEENAIEEKPVESPREKPTAAKRNSFFGTVFSRKEKKSPELKPTEPVEVPKETETTETHAPVIPPVEATTPLAVDVSNPTTVPVETTEIPAITTPTEPKRDTKEKRKSSLPFAFGKRDKSPIPSDGEREDKKERGKSPFSKLRATINRKTSSPRTDEKPVEETKVEEPIKDEVKTEEPAVAVEAPVEHTKAEPEVETKHDNVATTPAVTATA